jgi:hypothetical protein
MARIGLRRSEMSGSKRRPAEPTATLSKPPDQGEAGPTSGSRSKDTVGLVDDMPGAIRRGGSGVRRAIASILRRW